MAVQAEPPTCKYMARFEESVRRSVFLDDVAPPVTVATIRTALEQFGKVLNVRILECPLEPKLAAKRALVEMANPREARHVIKEIQEHPFIMMKGIPRPVIARPAEATLYPERPSKIRKTLHDDGKPKPSLCWVERGDPDWDSVHKQKLLAKKHVMECQYLMQELRKEEEKLAEEQDERAASVMDKFVLVDSCLKDKVVGQLSKYYTTCMNGHF